MASRRRAPARRGRRPPERCVRPGLPSVSTPAGRRPLAGRARPCSSSARSPSIMLAVPSAQGTLTDWARTVVLPNFGTGRWLLPVFLLMAGGLIEWRPARPRLADPRSSAAMVAYAALLGLIRVPAGPRRRRPDRHVPERDAARRGSSRPGAFVVLARGSSIGGHPHHRRTCALRRVRAARSGAGWPRHRHGRRRSARTRSPDGRRRGRGRAQPAAASGATADGRGPRHRRPAARAGRPAPVPERGADEPDGRPARAARSRRALRAAAAPACGRGAARRGRRSLDAADGYLPEAHRRGSCRRSTCSTIVPDAPATATRANHARTTSGSSRRSSTSFEIPATVVATNTGPGRHPVRGPAGARTSSCRRIEAPGRRPGDGPRGPHASGSRRRSRARTSSASRSPTRSQRDRRASGGSLEDAEMLDADEPTLTFALGRDVSGKAYAVDLAKMPHLLDRRRHRLGQERLRQRAHHEPPHARHARRGPAHPHRPQAGRARRRTTALPHLLQPVIVEPPSAQGGAQLGGAPRWRSATRRSPATSVRNIAAFNASPDVAPEERLPYIVIVIDELADLIMREGQQGRGPDRQDRPEGARRRASTSSSPRSARRSTS